VLTDRLPRSSGRGSRTAPLPAPSRSARRRGGRREREVERRPLPQLALGPDTAAVALNDALDDRQAHARSFELRLRMQALEHAEQLARVLHLETDSVVTHEVEGLAAPALTIDLDDGRIALPRELECIGQQIHQHLLQQRAVRIAALEFSDSYVHAPACISRKQLVREAPHERLERKAPPHQWTPPELGQGEQVLDELAHATRTGLHAIEQLPALCRNA